MNGFLELENGIGACLVHSPHQPGIAALPGLMHTHTHRPSADVSTETLQAREEWYEIFRVMQNKDPQPRLLYPRKVSFRIKGHINIFPDKKKLKQLSPPNQNHMKC